MASAVPLNQLLDLCHFKEIFNYLVKAVVAIKDVLILDDMSSSHVAYVKECLESTVRLGNDAAKTCCIFAEFVSISKADVLKAIDEKDANTLEDFLIEVVDKADQCQKQFQLLVGSINKDIVWQKKDQASAVSKLGEEVADGGFRVAKSGGLVTVSVGALGAMIKPSSLTVLDAVVATISLTVSTPYTGALVLIGGGGLVITLAGLITGYFGRGIAKRNEKLEEAYRTAHEKIRSLLSHWEINGTQMSSTDFSSNIKTTLEAWKNGRKRRKFVNGSKMIMNSFKKDMESFFDKMEENEETYKLLSQAKTLDEFINIP